MTTRPRSIILTLLLTCSTIVPTNGQTWAPSDRHDCPSGYDNYTAAENERRYRPVYPASYDRFESNRGFGDHASDRVRHEWRRVRDGYDYQAPLDSAVDDTFRRPISRWDDHRNSEFDRRDLRDLRDPFRLPAQDDFRSRPVSRERDLSDRDRNERRFRIPLRSWEDLNSGRGGQFDLNRRDDNRWPDLSDRWPQDRRWDDRPTNDNDRLDPFTPPLPRHDSDGDTEAILKSISARYSNPVNVRTVRSMSESQALQLYREVSQRTDERHLEPSSYDLRVRRAIRNLSLALRNQEFMSAMNLQVDSFRADSFQSALSSMSDRMQVRSQRDAEAAMQSVMQQGRSLGLPGSVVAFEFANATIDTLDKFSALEPAEPGRGAMVQPIDKRSASLEDEIVGIGVEIKAHDEGLLIVKPLRGGPAAEAGLEAGDIVVAINGRSIRGLPLAQSVDLMKGTSGTRLNLSIVRNGGRSRDVTLTLRKVRIYTVDAARLQSGTDGVAYISLNQFGQRSTEELDQALMDLYRKGMKSLVLDLRGNPGGLLNVCVDITNRFLPCGTIVSTKGRLTSDNMLEQASYSRTWKTPLVVLVDQDSASASEIFAAAVQDNQRGIVVGTRSYGKGTVQTHFPLNSISGNLRLTTARFYSPSGRAMSGEGVSPDVLIEDVDGPANGDRMLEEAMRIAQSQRLRDIADAAARCKRTSESPQRRNSVDGNIFDGGLPQTVIR
jgi:carboxyl-terminal processing protease